MSNDDEEYFLPLVDQRVFGAGIRRQKVKFVPEIGHVSPSAPSESAGSRYLNIVMKNKDIPQTLDPAESSHEQSTCVCTKCGHVHGQPIEGENDCVHDFVDLAAKTPSHIDRNRLGHRLLTSQGWNADARTGLGRNAEGIAVPVKAVQKNDTAGLGLMTESEDHHKAQRARRTTSKTPIVKQNAKQARAHAALDAKRTAQLRETLYGSIELEKLMEPNA